MGLSFFSGKAMAFGAISRGIARDGVVPLMGWLMISDASVVTWWGVIKISIAISKAINPTILAN